ncbi:MAG: hypothetical protein JRN20_07410 [Nitrososphaerota archaeon]|nr:hypothetical protein [Nitrososphaerota archaeon]
MGNNDTKISFENKPSEEHSATSGSRGFESVPESWQHVNKKFVETAGKVFSRNSPDRRVRIAETEAQMLWLAWRGSDEYLVRHSGNVSGLQSSWQICFYKDISRILEQSQSREEFRPMAEEFSEPVMASIINQINEFCSKRNQLSLRESPKMSAICSEPEVFVEKMSEANLPERVRVEILSSMSLIQAGCTLFIRWPMKKAKLLFPKAIEVSAKRLVLQNYPSLMSANTDLEDPSLTAIRGYLRFAKQKDRLEGQRKRRLGVLRWLSTQRE